MECGGTGYRGRTAIHELLDLTDPIREMILAKKPTSEVRKLAQKEGMTFLRESALDRVRRGLTTLKEINKVTFIEASQIVNSILSKAKLGSQPGARPPAAVELSPQGVLAAAIAGRRASRRSMPLSRCRPGALVPGIGEQNLRAPEVVANAMRAALGQVSPRTRAVTLVSARHRGPRLCTGLRFAARQGRRGHSRSPLPACARWFPSRWSTPG